MALKAGRAPREGVRFLSVGMDGVVTRLQQAFQDACSSGIRPLIVLGDYGEGKSHLLRLTAELAHENGFAWTMVTHDRDQQIGLHKPAWLFRRLLWELQWNYPQVRLWKWHPFMDNPPSYGFDREMRYTLPAKLKEVADDLRGQDFQGLVVCLDELDNYNLLAGKQRPIFREVLDNLLHSRMPFVVCLLSTVVSVSFDIPEEERIVPPPLEPELLEDLTQRIWQLHEVAFQWKPTVAPEELTQRAWQKAALVPSGRWRVFIQAVVTELEIAHQRIAQVSAAVPTRPIVHAPLQPQPQPPKPITSPMKPPIFTPQPKPPSVQVGDWVEIIAGPLRGWRGRVETVKDEKVLVIIHGRTTMRIWVPLISLKRVRNSGR